MAVSPWPVMYSPVSVACIDHGPAWPVEASYSGYTEQSPGISSAVTFGAAAVKGAAARQRAAVAVTNLASEAILVRTL